jgi:hypothetical protein
MIERISQWRSNLDGATSLPIPDGVRLPVLAVRITALAERAAAEQPRCPVLRLPAPPGRSRPAPGGTRAPADVVGLLTDQLRTTSCLIDNTFRTTGL